MKLYLELTLEIKFRHLLTRCQCRHYRPFSLALPTDPGRYFSNQFGVTFNSLRVAGKIYKFKFYIQLLSIETDHDALSGNILG